MIVGWAFGHWLLLPFDGTLDRRNQGAALLLLLLLPFFFFFFFIYN
jgi:hypothetical protein